MMFKKHKELVELWNVMDGIILKLKNKKAITHWKKKGIPHRVITGDETAPYYCHNDQGKIVPLKYDDIKVNRYMWSWAFNVDSQARLEKVFMECLAM